MRGPRLPKPPAPNPSGLCMCSCGQVTPRAAYTSRRDGTVHGEHIRFIRGHNQRKAGPWLNRTNGRWYVYGVDRSRVPWARIVLRHKLGRELLPGHVAHHLNGDEADDRPENLVELDIPTHRRLHAYVERGSLTLAAATELVLG